jgi:hypothetical protein
MTWTPEQIDAAWRASVRGTKWTELPRELITAIMDSARDALAAAGVMMTEMDPSVYPLRMVLEGGAAFVAKENVAKAHNALRHVLVVIAAQGAKVAELKASADELERQRNRSNEALEVAEGVRDALRTTAAELETQLGELETQLGEWKRGSHVAFNEAKALKAERDVARADARCMKHEADLAKTAAAALREELDRERARKWVQCTSVSNECLGGCRTMAEHDRYRDAQLRADVGATKSESLRGAVLRVVKERDEARAAYAELVVKPPGQVAEDVAMLDHAVRSATMGPRDAQLRAAWIAALSRLADLAQRTQDAEACAKMAGEDQDKLAALAAEIRSSLVTAESQLRAIRERATKASAELRHAYRPETRDWNLVARAIRILEEATTPNTPARPVHPPQHRWNDAVCAASKCRADWSRPPTRSCGFCDSCCGHARGVCATPPKQP